MIIQTRATVIYVYTCMCSHLLRHEHILCDILSVAPIWLTLCAFLHFVLKFLFDLYASFDGAETCRNKLLTHPKQ
jgi:hypothetical protein